MDPLTEWLSDVSSAEWIRERLTTFGVNVASIVPGGFEAHARVFHPAPDLERGTRRWAELARQNGRIVHPEMQFHMISRAPGTPLSDRSYGAMAGLEEGSLPVRERAVLVEILRRATSTPDRCSFCIWDGFGNLDTAGVSARVHLPHRQYLLARGPIERALDSFTPWGEQSANLWWPDDHAWVVATEIDFTWTYVAGSARAVADLINDRRIEAIEVHTTDGIRFDSDAANAALDDA